MVRSPSRLVVGSTVKLDLGRPQNVLAAICAPLKISLGRIFHVGFTFLRKRARGSASSPPPLGVGRAQTAVVPRTRGCPVTTARSCVAGRSTSPSRPPLAPTPRSDRRAFALRAKQMADADALQPLDRSVERHMLGACRIRQGRVGRVPWLPSRACPIAACAAFVLIFRRNVRTLCAIGY